MPIFTYQVKCALYMCGRRLKFRTKKTAENVVDRAEFPDTKSHPIGNLALSTTFSVVYGCTKFQCCIS